MLQQQSRCFNHNFIAFLVSRIQVPQSAQSGHFRVFVGCFRTQVNQKRYNGIKMVIVHGHHECITQ